MVDEMTDEGVLQWLGHLEGIYNDKIAQRAYVGECAGSRSVGMSRKIWIDTVKECLEKRGLNVRQARRMVHGRSVWWVFGRENE